MFSDPINFIDQDGLLPSLPQGLVDFAAGFGDAISFGLTDYIRDKIDVNSSVDKCSSSYSAGEYAGIAHGFATGGVGALKALGTKTAAKSGDDFFKGTKYTDKVKIQMQKDDFHSFPRSVEGFQDAGKVTKFKGGDGITRERLEILGGFKGKKGKFEFIKEPNGTINHRYFRPNGQ